MFISDVGEVLQCLWLVCVTCRLSCLDEELLLLRDKEEIFCDMAELRSSEPISLQSRQCRLRLEYQEHSSIWRKDGSGDRVMRREGGEKDGFNRQAL